EASTHYASPMASSETTPRQAIAFIQDELDTAALYDTLAGAEVDSRLAEVYRRLAAAERRHAEHWEAKLRAGGVRVPPFRASWRAPDQWRSAKGCRSRAPVSCTKSRLRWRLRRFGPIRRKKPKSSR